VPSSFDAAPPGVLGPRGAARLVARGAWLLVESYAAPSTAPDDGDSQ